MRTCRRSAWSTITSSTVSDIVTSAGSASNGAHTQWERHSERGSFPRTVALRIDRSAVHRDDRGDDVKSESETAGAFSCAVLLECLENMRQKIGVDAVAFVCDDDLRSRRIRFERCTHVLARRSEFDRIAQKVPNDLLQPRAVARQVDRLIGKLRFHDHSASTRLVIDDVDRVPNDITEVERFASQSQLSFTDSRRVQKILDEYRLCLSALFDPIERLGSNRR